MFCNRTYVILLIHLSLKLVPEPKPIQGCPLKLRNNQFWQLLFWILFILFFFFSNCFLISILIPSSCFSSSNFVRNFTSCSWSSLRLDFACSQSANSWIALSTFNITVWNYNVLSSSCSSYASISASSFFSVMISCSFYFKSYKVSILVSILVLHFSSSLHLFLANNLLLSLSANVTFLMLFSIEIFVCSKLSTISENFDFL